jgi:transcriptional regulator with XRE-family HTH domain
MGTRKIELGDVGLRVAAQIRQIRERKSLSLQDLSESLSKLGRPILPSGLWKIEQGTRRVDVDDLAAIARALEIVPSTLLNPAPESARTASGEDADLSDVVADAMDALRRCEQAGIDRYNLIDWYGEIDAELERLSVVLTRNGLTVTAPVGHGLPPGVVVRPSDWYERAKHAKGGADA